MFSLLARRAGSSTVRVSTYWAKVCALKVAASASDPPCGMTPGVTFSFSVAWYVSDCRLEARKITAPRTAAMMTIRSQFCAMTRKCEAKSMNRP